MSVFTSRITTTMPIPGELGQSVTLRKLAPKHLRRAAQDSQRAALEDLKAIGGTAVLKEFSDLGSKKAAATPETPAAPVDPLDGYDRITLMELGVTEWTLDAARTRETFEDLDESTQHWLGTEILKLAKPSAYATTEEAEAQRKND